MDTPKEYEENATQIEDQSSTSSQISEQGKLTFEFENEFVRSKNMEQFMGPFHVREGVEITLDSFGAILEETLNNYGIPRKYGTGSLANPGIFSSDTEAIFLKHPNHVGDYINFAFTVLHSGSTAIINVYSYGKSRQLGNQALANTRIMDGGGARATTAGLLRGGSVGVGFAVGGAMAGIVKGGVRAIKKGIGAMRLDNDALAEEQAWYELIAAAISDIFA